MEWISKSPKETIRLGEKLMEEFPEHRLICLEGELGSGKTCFMKGIGRALNVSENMIKSPTFTTVFTYQSGENIIHHCDFYRCEKLEDFPVDWWRDFLDQNTLVVVEWSDRIKPHLPVPRIEVQFVITDENERKLIINEILHEKKRC